MAANAYRGARVLGGAILSALVLAAGVAPAAHAVAPFPVLTSAQQEQVSALAAKLLDLVKTMSSTASEGAFEGALVDASQGYDPSVIVAAMHQVQGTPGLPAAAVAAAGRVARSYASNDPRNNGTGALGTPSGNAPGTGSPGFASGGGGGGSSTYTK